MMSDGRKKYAGRQRASTPGAGKFVRWLCSVLLGGAVGCLLHAQDTELSLPRPGAVLVLDLIGEATAIAGEQQKPVQVDQRLRVGSTIVTERMSLVTLILSNGATLRIGSESELEVEEFGQATALGLPKYVELKEEPTVSRTRLRLVRGDVLVDLKPLNAARGSSFLLSMLAGTVRSTDGMFHVRVRMSDLGLGVCTLELEKGTAEFEPVGGKFAPIPPGRTLTYALELDRITGAVKVSEMPKEAAKATTK
jgi:hypothetical protein